MEKHVTVVGALHIGFGVLGILAARGTQHGKRAFT